MTQLGDGGRPAYAYFAYDTTANPNQVGQLYTAPVQMRIIGLGAWLAGWNDNSHCRLAVWDDALNLLGYTDEFVAVNRGAASGDNHDLYVFDLQTPVIIDNGADFYVGTIRNRDEGVSWPTGSNAENHFEARAAYPDGDLGAVSGPNTVARRVGAYVADYEPVGSAWVRRSGAWSQASKVQVYRSGAWVDADSVQVLRSGVWTDAE